VLRSFPTPEKCKKNRHFNQEKHPKQQQDSREGLKANKTDSPEAVIQGI